MVVLAHQYLNQIETSEGARLEVKETRCTRVQHVIQLLLLVGDNYRYILVYPTCNVNKEYLHCAPY